MAGSSTRLTTALALAAAATVALAQPEARREPIEGPVKAEPIEPVIPSVTAERQAARCRELAGVLREQCLRDLGSADAGDSAAPRPASPAPAQRDPAIDPPPQNPRPNP